MDDLIAVYRLLQGICILLRPGREGASGPLLHIGKKATAKKRRHGDDNSRKEQPWIHQAQHHRGHHSRNGIAANERNGIQPVGAVHVGVRRQQIQIIRTISPLKPPPWAQQHIFHDLPFQAHFRTGKVAQSRSRGTGMEQIRRKKQACRNDNPPNHTFPLPCLGKLQNSGSFIQA